MIELTPDHKYMCDGICLPGFSEIARATGLVKFFNSDPWFMERGTAVHTATALMDRNLLDWDTIDERIQGYVDAYHKFKCEQPFNDLEHVEESLKHPTYAYCGTLDRFLPLLDIKTGQGDVIQLEAYAELLRANGYDPGRVGYLLNLNGDGTYSLKIHKYDRKLLGVWLSAVSVFHYRKEKGLLS